MTSRKNGTLVKNGLSSTGSVLSPTEAPLLLASPNATSLTLKLAYNRAIIGGIFIDVVFYAYSCRTASGIVCKPRPVYANSAILRAASPYFESLMSGGFRESKIRNIDEGFPSDKDAYTTEYDYDSDSDLESIEDEVDRIAETTTEAAPNSLSANPVTTPTLDINNVSTSVHNVPDQGPSPVRLGQVIVIPNIAYTTLRALVSYMGCGSVAFLPLKSSGKRRDLHVSLSKISEQPLHCSPKSMYRVAVMLDLKDLKIQAERDIKAKLNKENILPELFSRFSSSYDEISNTQIRILYDNRRSDAIRQTIPSWARRIVQGELGHVANVLECILDFWLKGTDPEVGEPETSFQFATKS